MKSHKMIKILKNQKGNLDQKNTIIQVRSTHVIFLLILVSTQSKAIIA